MTCGINLAVTQKKVDIKNGDRFVVTYPNICANCGKPVSRRPKKVPSTNGVVLPPIYSEEVQMAREGWVFCRYRSHGVKSAILVSKMLTGTFEIKKYQA